MAGSSHGHTPAAWTGVIIAFIGFCVSGAFMVMANPLGFWAGMVIIAVGGLVGLAMRAAGLGQAPRRQQAKAQLAHSEG
ncbi:HGxxPAAW family protein [Streptomyces sp. NPDC050658]|uniref:HGxxPAAW family protein n=1 Tax=unclassified Streptomyces TaxID=2593676 RepID=UPI003414A3D9